MRLLGSRYRCSLTKQTSRTRDVRYGSNDRVHLTAAMSLFGKLAGLVHKPGGAWSDASDLQRHFFFFRTYDV